MDETKTKESDETYKLSKEERKDLLERELKSLSNTLSGYQMNSELETAWVTTIVPPDADAKGKPQTDGEIAIEFILPSEDTFWETFNFPDKRWPEDNEFRQFIESLDYYSPDDLPELISREVDVVYDEDANKWRISSEFKNDTEKNEKDTRGFLEGLDSMQKGILLFSVVVGIPLSFILLVRLRQFSIPIIGMAILGLYLVLKA